MSQYHDTQYFRGDHCELDFLQQFLPWHLPRTWDRVTVPEGIAGFAYQSGEGLRVIVSAARESDGQRWLYVSISRYDRSPSFEDTIEVKELFIGSNKTALQVFPARMGLKRPPHVVRLWHCLDGDAGPDFIRHAKTLQETKSGRQLTTG